MTSALDNPGHVGPEGCGGASSISSSPLVLWLAIVAHPNSPTTKLPIDKRLWNKNENM
jgi:hypothetical protein